MTKILEKTSMRAGRHEDVPIPFVDLAAAHSPIRARIDAAIASVIDESAFVGGRRVEVFEDAFARFCGSRHAVAVGSGTDALRIALQCAGVGPGDVVITVSMTFFATVEGILQVGAVPLLIDVDPITCCMDPAALEGVLRECRRGTDGVRMPDGARIGAILPVHLYGLPADMGAIRRVAEEWKVPVIEDAAQAHGAELAGSGGKRCGALGLLGAFSFYPSKNLGAMGEAGAITTDDAQLAEQARMLREHGQSDRYHHQLPDGSNARLDGIQAAILAVKLEQLQKWNEERREIARWYDAAFDANGVWRQGKGHDTWGHVYHLYVIQVERRDEVRDRLMARGIATGIHYPVPVHLQPAMKRTKMVVAGGLPASEQLAARCLSLPMYPGLGRPSADRVIEAVLEATGAA